MKKLNIAHGVLRIYIFGSPNRSIHRTFQAVFEMAVARSDHNLIRVDKGQYRNPIYLAMEWQRALDSGQCESLSALAWHFKVSRARVTQIMNLLSLSLDVIDIIRSLGDPINSPVVTERRLRPLLSLPDGEQAKQIKALLFKDAQK